MTRGKGTIIGVLVMVAVFTLASVPVSAWEASGDLAMNPATVYPGTQATFSWIVENTGSEPMQVTNVWIGFDWQTGGQGYLTSDIPVTIDSGDSHTFTFPVSIPDGIPSNTEHVVTIETTAADPDGSGGWDAGYSAEITKYITVSTPTTTPDPTPDPVPDPVDDTTDDTSDDDSEGTPGFTFPIMVSALFIGVGIMTIARRYRKN